MNKRSRNSRWQKTPWSCHRHIILCQHLCTTESDQMDARSGRAVKHHYHTTPRCILSIHIRPDQQVDIHVYQPDPDNDNDSLLRLAALISEKQNQQYSTTLLWMRCDLMSLSLIRSVSPGSKICLPLPYLLRRHNGCGMLRRPHP